MTSFIPTQRAILADVARPVNRPPEGAAVRMRLAYYDFVSFHSRMARASSTLAGAEEGDIWNVSDRVQMKIKSVVKIVLWQNPTCYSARSESLWI